MPLISVTLDVSRLSGWLNANARCRVETLLREAGRGAGKGTGEGRGVTVAQVVCMGKVRVDIGRKAAGGAHLKHAAHGRDAGRVEAQRLVERRRVLPSHNGAHGGVTRGAIGARAWGGAVAVHAACPEGPTGHWGHGTRAGGRARKMLSMLVTLDVSKLSGWLNAVASCRVTTGLTKG